MKPLSQTNPHLRDPKKRVAMVVRNVIASSVFEGARGLSAKSLRQCAEAALRDKASTKNSTSGLKSVA